MIFDRTGATLLSPACTSWPVVGRPPRQLRIHLMRFVGDHPPPLVRPVACDASPLADISLSAATPRHARLRLGVAARSSSALRGASQPHTRGGTDMADNRRDEMIEKLTEGIKHLTTSAEWQRWLTIQSRFHRYSFNNTLLIQLQHPDATRVAGFRAWQQMGRQVRKGEKAIWILAPVTKKADQVDLEVNADSPDAKGRV